MTTATKTLEIRPQRGPQERWLASPADISLFGGGAGGGKTFGLLMEPLRHIHNPRFGAVIFRRTSPQITNEGGLWDESSALYPLLGAMPYQTRLEWRFPSRAKIRFSHLEYDKNIDDWYGSQIPLIGFDQLEQFTAKMFWGMVSRNRSTCGVRPYIRANCNPDPDSFVFELIEWWIDQETGYPIPERAAVLRWFLRVNNELHWYDSREGAREDRQRLSLSDDVEPKSFTFVPALLTDNKILMQKDPGYMANLQAMPLVERERLLGGNWKIRPSAGTVFKRHWFPIVDAAPAEGRDIRMWDLAATEPHEGNKDPDWTVGIRQRHLSNGQAVVLDMRRDRLTPLKVKQLVKNTADQDGTGVMIGIALDPGQAGKAQVADYMNLLKGYNVRIFPISKNKVERSKPVSAQSEQGNILLLRAAWNEPFLQEVESFPDGKHDDIVDSFSDGYNAMTAPAAVVLTSKQTRKQMLGQSSSAHG